MKDTLEDVHGEWAASRDHYNDVRRLLLSAQERLEEAEAAVERLTDLVAERAAEEIHAIESMRAADRKLQAKLRELGPEKAWAEMTRIYAEEKR